MEILLYVILAFFVFLFIGIVANIKEKSPENQMIKAKKKQSLDEELAPLELAKVHVIKTSAVLERPYHVGISTKTKQLVIYKPIEQSTDDVCVVKIAFNSIIGCEILEDNETIQKGGVGRAVVGGVLAGGVGALVGAATRKTMGVVNSLKIRIALNDVVNPCYEITLIHTQTKRSSDQYIKLYQVAQDIYSTVLAIEADNKVDTDEQHKTETSSTSNADELRKYKELFNDGIITQEEFEAKKKQLLGL